MNLKEFAIRAAAFLRRNGFRNSGYVITYAMHYFDGRYRKNPNYLSESDLERAIDAGKSLIRLGDGESYIMNYGSIHYQDFDPLLRDGLLE